MDTVSKRDHARISDPKSLIIPLGQRIYMVGMPHNINELRAIAAALAPLIDAILSDCSMPEVAFDA